MSISGYQLALHDLHLSHGATMVEFANYQMPLQYKQGIKTEHLHCREKAALFDISHMGQFLLSGDGVETFLEQLTPSDIEALKPNSQKYTVLTTKNGGILDDLIITKFDDEYLLVVNASRKKIVREHILAHKPKQIVLDELNDYALIAIQGPLSQEILEPIFPDISEMLFLDAQKKRWNNENTIISRSGYTGEDGFEISLPNLIVRAFVQDLLKHNALILAGLGARNSLRLEAGLCLYGNDINTETTPIEANLQWVINPSRRLNGTKVGGFIGDESILEQLSTMNIERKRIGLVGKTKLPVRAGAILSDKENKHVGQVTSGTFSPTCESAIAMGYVSIKHATLNSTIFAEVRGRKCEMVITNMPFISTKYKKNDKHK